MKKLSLVAVTSGGMIKKTAAVNFLDVRKSGIIAMKLKPNDVLFSTFFVEERDDIILTTKKGQAIRFKESQLREMGRSTGGVRAMRLSSEDNVLGAGVIKNGQSGATLLVMSEKGYGKKTRLKEYKVQARGGRGIKTARLNDKTGKLVWSLVITEDVQEIVAISKHSIVIRTGLGEIPTLGRASQGVRIMKLRAGDKVATFICF